MSIHTKPATPAATEIRDALADTKARLAVLAGNPLLTEDVGVIAEAMTKLPSEQLKEQIRHQLTLARYWYTVATTLVDGAMASAEREAALLITASDAHAMAAGSNQMAAAALSLAAARRP